MKGSIGGCVGHFLAVRTSGNNLVTGCSYHEGVGVGVVCLG